MNIRILKDSELPNPEDRAMLCALYSRSNSSVEEHLKKVASSDSGSFMSRYYIGYGHDSIGDCATATVFFEGVSMLAAVSLEHNELFNGQESSTRYIDFSTQPRLVSRIFRPSEDTLFHDLYAKVKKRVTLDLNTRYPYTEDFGVTESVYNNAVAARAFDVARGFLLCGYTTNVALVGSLRMIRRHMHRLRHSPYIEVRSIAERALRELHDIYPNTFEHDSKWLAYDERHPENSKQAFQTCIPDADPTGAGVYECLEADKLDHQIAYSYGTIDFGSYRDMHRHRTLMTAQSSPSASGIFKIHPYYMDFLTNDERESVLAYMDECRTFALSHENADVCELDYVLPMGTLVHYRLIGPLDKMEYYFRLRSSQSVHPTLRDQARQAALHLVHQRHIVATHSYYETTEPLYLPRGTQTLTEKK